MNGYTEAQVLELGKEIKKNSVTAQYRRRVQAVYCLALGDNSFDVAERSRFSERSIRNFRRRYIERGLIGLQSNYVGSNYRKLSYEQEAAALDKISKTADLGEYARSKEIAAAFEMVTGVKYASGAFLALLKRHGWRKVAPRGAHPKKASAEVIEASKKLTLWSKRK